MSAEASRRQAIRLVLTGRVQGVGFRYYATRQARELGLAGWVRNREDGAVEAVAVGEAAALEQFRTALRRGPAGARVAHLEENALEETPPEASAGFHVVD